METSTPPEANLQRAQGLRDRTDQTNTTENVTEATELEFSGWPILLSEKSQFGLAILGAALVLGILGNGLLRTPAWGINVGLWIGFLFLAAAAFVYWRKLPLLGEGRWLLGPAVFLAFTFAWRDSLTLQWINGLALLVTLALMARHTLSGQLRRLSVSDYAHRVTRAWRQTLSGFVRLCFNDIEWHEIPHAAWFSPAKAIARGLLITLPLVFFFGSLFVSADAVFGELASHVFEWLFLDLFGHVFFIGLFAWLAGGWLRQTLLEQHEEEAGSGGARHSSIGIIEICVVLGGLNLLFLAFVVVQVGHLFGGQERVVLSHGLTYAEYARSGFFELVAVTTFVLPVLLVSHSLLHTENAVHERIFCGLAGSLVGLLFVVMVSAFQRMFLYQAVYGLTELRLYTTAFMGWLAAVFVWFSLTVLRGRRDRFAFGGLVSMFGLVLILNSLNPDALIVRTNVARLKTGAAFDASYAMSLGADAVPVLIEGVAELQKNAHETVARLLLIRWTSAEAQDWRSWNWSRGRAKRLVTADQVRLRDLAALGDNAGWKESGI